MIRIQVVEQSSSRVVLILEGQLVEDAVDVLAQEGACWLPQTKCLVLNLAGLQRIDRLGIHLLQSWDASRLELSHASHFIRALLERHGLLVAEGGG